VGRAAAWTGRRPAFVPREGHRSPLAQSRGPGGRGASAAGRCPVFVDVSRGPSPAPSPSSRCSSKGTPGCGRLSLRPGGSHHHSRWSERRSWRGRNEFLPTPTPRAARLARFVPGCDFTSHSHFPWGEGARVALLVRPKLNKSQKAARWNGPLVGS
jgi:hypothetical protein